MQFSREAFQQITRTSHCTQTQLSQQSRPRRHSRPAHNAPINNKIRYISPLLGGEPARLTALDSPLSTHRSRLTALDSPHSPVPTYDSPTTLPPTLNISRLVITTIYARHPAFNSLLQIQYHIEHHKRQLTLISLMIRMPD